LYDANGNVGQLIDSAGSIAAHYEYDPYGKLLKAEGGMAAENPFRFSTKYFDDETGLGYWGYRYYSPELGRWLNRDPIGEIGGLNLYALVMNNIVNRYDMMGLASVMIDPGHGDVFEKFLDGGTEGINKKAPHEKDFALDLSLEIGKGLEALGHTIKYTRTDDINEKQVRWKWRTDKALENKCEYFISVHLNAVCNAKGECYPERNHFMVAYYSEEGKRLAESIKEFVEQTGFESNNLEKHAYQVLTLSEKNKIVAVLIEAGNIKNPENAGIIKSKSFIDQIVSGVNAAIKTMEAKK